MGRSAFDATEPNRIVDVKVIDFTKLKLANTDGTRSVVDVTRETEPPSATNTLYLVEDNLTGTAEMTIQSWWEPEDIHGNWFLWDIVLTNGAAGAVEWSSTNGMFQTANPRTVQWKSASAVGATNRNFLVRGWYSCDRLLKFNPDLPHRMLYVTVIGVDLDIDSDNNNGFSDPDRNAVEEALEDEPGHPGKALAINHLDLDKDGIPDFADGFDIEFDGVSQAAANASHDFVPVIFEFSEGIDTNAATVIFRGDYLSNPATDVERTGGGTNGNPYVYSIVGDGRVRLWHGKNGSDSRLKSAIRVNPFLGN